VLAVQQAQRPLDALNFFLADIRDGLGPYLASREHLLGQNDAINLVIELASQIRDIATYFAHRSFRLDEFLHDLSVAPYRGKQQYSLCHDTILPSWRPRILRG